MEATLNREESKLLLEWVARFRASTKNKKHFKGVTLDHSRELICVETTSLIIEIPYSQVILSK